MNDLILLFYKINGVIHTEELDGNTEVTYFMRDNYASMDKNTVFQWDRGLGTWYAAEADSIGYTWVGTKVKRVRGAPQVPNEYKLAKTLAGY